MSLFRSTLLLAIAMAVLGCATMIQGTRQNISVGSTPSGAAVLANGKIQGRTPIQFDLKRKEQATITVVLDGFHPYTVAVKRTVDLGMLWAMLPPLGLISLPVDLSTGAVYALEPTNVHAQLVATMQKEPERKGEP